MFIDDLTLFGLIVTIICTFAVVFTTVTNR